MNREAWFRERGMIYEGEIDGRHVGRFDHDSELSQLWQRVGLGKEAWKPGPWHSEPDYATWMTMAGLPGLIVRGGAGALCGYVGVSAGHALYGKGYNTPEGDVHGGLTYADRCGGRICHQTAGEDHVWWFGFDCHHTGDYAPKDSAMAAYMASRGHQDDALWRDTEGTPTGWGGCVTYRDFAYVTHEVERLAEQLARPTGEPAPVPRCPHGVELDTPSVMALRSCGECDLARSAPGKETP